MKALDVMQHFRDVGQWVDWKDTVDRFLHGDPEAEVRGIAVAWIPTNEAIREASARGCNLFITHEPAFYPGFEGAPTHEKLVTLKRDLLDGSGMTLLRCHDTWDRMPRVGIVDAWAEFLGWEVEERPVESFTKICLLDGLTVAEAAREILGKVRPLGQETVAVFGDGGRNVRRMAVGTGAITHLPSMFALKPDVILATDDGMNFWTGGLWAADMAVPLLIVNHATSEKPGMQAMAPYLRTVFPSLPVETIEVGFALRAAGPEGG
ncbi:MAG: Nif3-like dinuclear metal center hexameric protein [Planctomycetota bacterium]|jgi:putative NIF3 family GTP cyclohydrolase 1 type 2